jgi:hypothetical protein
MLIDIDNESIIYVKNQKLQSLEYLETIVEMLRL